MRGGIDGLSQRIQNLLGRSPCDGSAYAFRNRRRNRLKLLDLGWHRRLAVSSPTASGALHLAEGGRRRRSPSPHAQWQWLITGCRLAAARGAGTGALAGVSSHANTVRKIMAVTTQQSERNDLFTGLARCRSDRIRGMDLHAELARLIADPELAESVAHWSEARRSGAQSRRTHGEQMARRDTELHAAQHQDPGPDAGTGAPAADALRRQERSPRCRDARPVPGNPGQRYGRRRSRTGQAAGEAAGDTPADGPPKRARAGRQPLPDHLPRIEHRHEPESCPCDQCGKDLVKIGEDVSEQLDVEPAQFFVHRHIRPQYACRACETVTAAPIPPAVIDGGMAAVGLLGLGDRRQVPRSPAAVSPGAHRRPGRCHAVALDPGGMGGTHRRGTATAG